jgi:hypothetical protein
MNTPLTVSVHMTYRDSYSGRPFFMREVSWRDRSGEFCWVSAGDARGVTRKLRQLAAEFGSLSIIRFPQESAWK